jgi:NADPH2:quinone reductase
VNAIRIDACGGTEMLRFVETAPPVAGPGELLIRQCVIGVNFIDVYYRTGRYPRSLPFVPGREAAGVVDAVGPGVTGFERGMRVVYGDSPSLGAYAQFNAVGARSCVAIPDGVADDVACAAFLQGVTAQFLATESYSVAPGDAVLIHAAAGGVGRLLVQFAKRRGATVIATVGGQRKTDLARTAGADHVIDYRAIDFQPEVMRLTGGVGVAAVYDSVGKDTWERSLRSLRTRGSFVLFGASSGAVPPIDPLRLAAAGSILFSRPLMDHFTRTHGELSKRANEVFDGIRDGTLDVHIDTTYTLAQAARAHQNLEARTSTGKLLLVP